VQRRHGKLCRERNGLRNEPELDGDVRSDLREQGDVLDGERDGVVHGRSLWDEQLQGRLRRLQQREQRV
jgi:hypothetical protein